jgi:hypothetical protein
MAEPEKPLDLDSVVDWPPEARKIGSLAHVHGIGMIALRSAMMEEALTLLLSHLLNLNRQISIPLIHKLPILERAELLRKLVGDEKMARKELAAHLIHATNCFKICAENRNFLVHAIYESTDQFTATMTVKKRSKRNPLNEFRMELPVPILRRIAEEIGNTVNFMLDLWINLTPKGGPPALPGRQQKFDICGGRPPKKLATNRHAGELSDGRPGHRGRERHSDRAFTRRCCRSTNLSGEGVAAPGIVP